MSVFILFILGSIIISSEEINIEMIIKQDLESLIDSKSIYTYQRSFRDPFSDYRQDKTEFEKLSGLNDDTLDYVKLRSLIPFKLKGIMGNTNNWLVIVNKSSTVKFLTKGDTISGFTITEVWSEGITVTYSGISLDILLRSGIIETE